MKNTSFVRRITKCMAGAAASVLIITSVMATAMIPVQAYVWPDRDLEMEMTGEDVLSLQMRLAELGYAVGEPDGYFGENTLAALIEYQSDMGLYADGIAGPQTLAALGM